MTIAHAPRIHPSARDLACATITRVPSLIAVANRDRQPRSDEWLTLCLVAAQLRDAAYQPLPIQVVVAAERLAPEIVAQHTLPEQQESAYRLADLLCQMGRVLRCPICPRFLDGLHACKQRASQTLLDHFIHTGRVVCGAGHAPDLADADAIAVPAADLRAFEQTVLAVQAFQRAVQGQVPAECALPVLLRDTAGAATPLVQADLRITAQAVWISFPGPTGQTCATVVVAYHNGQIALNAWTGPLVEDQAAVSTVLIDTVAALTTTTEDTHDDT